MSIFGNILSKLGFGNARTEEAAVTTAAAPVETAATAGAAAVQQPATNVQQAAPGAAPAAATMSAVDVVAKLEALSRSHAEKLNWKTSIVDLMKLLGLDSSLAARKELATELGCPADKMSGSAQMNMWLHKTVLQKLAENGGNIPANMLD